MIRGLFFADLWAESADLACGFAFFFKIYSCLPEGPCRAGAPQAKPAGPKMIQNLPLPARKSTRPDTPIVSYVITASIKIITRQQLLLPGIPIIKYANVVVVVVTLWIFKNIQFQYSFRVTRSTARYPAPSDRMPVPRRPHTSLLRVSGDTAADDSQLGQRGA